MVIGSHVCKESMCKAVGLHSITQSCPSIVNKTNAAMAVWFDHAVGHAEHNEKILPPVAVTPDALCPAF